jgi:siroheme synthase (precorrin-2 oxidase/ferrochelatase)
MSDVYNLLILSAITAQEIRTSDDEAHNPDCTHAACVEERAARGMMASLPEHKKKQSSWRSFMRELRDASKEHNLPIMEDDEYKELLRRQGK